MELPIDPQKSCAQKKTLVRIAVEGPEVQVTVGDIVGYHYTPVRVTLIVYTVKDHRSWKEDGFKSIVAETATETINQSLEVTVESSQPVLV